MIFKKNERVTTQDNKTFIVKDLLGEGGQGEVYLVDFEGKNYALKIYNDIPSSDFIYNLKNNINRGAPSESFLWPLLFINVNDKHIGYLMELRPKNFNSFVSYLTGTKVFKDQYTLVSWCIELCLAFKKLHENGFSYQDLNDGSFFFDEETGKLLICDNDNVTADKKNLGILGKMRYMAPEIVRRDLDEDGNECMPDTHSDRFSLAVILFMTLCLGNPFEGEFLKNYDIVDEKSDLEMFGTKPLFIYHKTNKSNRPIRGYHTSVIKRWPKLPIYIKEAFHRTFVDGLQDRENERTTELEWIKVLTKYRDELITCSCGKQFICGFDEKELNNTCPYCNTDTKKYCTLLIGKNRVALEPGKKLYEYHIDKYSANYNKEMGIVIVNKNNPSLWGIRLNISNTIEIKDASGNIKEIPDTGVIPIINNLEIKFDDNLIGKIKI